MAPTPSARATSVLVGLPDGTWRIHIHFEDGLVIKLENVYSTMRAAEKGLEQVYRDHPDIRIL